MWTEKAKNGKVRYVERYTDPMTGKTHRAVVVMDKDTARNRKLAQAALDEKISADPSDMTGLTLSQLVDLYRASQKLTVRESTYTRNYHAQNSLMRILGSDTLVSSLSARYVNSRLLSNGEKPGTINERIERLKALLRWGYENDYVDDISWLGKVKKQRDDEKAEKLENKYLEADELNLLLDSMRVDKWRFLAELTALSGLRVGEAVALETADVDVEVRKLHISKTYDSVNNVVGYPKTHASNRDVYMQDELLNLCKGILDYMEKERAAANYRSKLFISDITGEHLNYYSYNKYLGEVSEQKLHRRITSHYMRHTHVALMAEQGVPLDVISRRLGHSDSSITKNIYFHVTERLKDKDNARIKDVKLL